MRKKNKEIGLRIKQLREEKGLSKLAFSRSIGVNDSSLGKIERGEIGITRDTLIKIRQIYGVTYDWIIDGVENPLVPGKLVSDSPGSLLLKIYTIVLNMKASNKATAHFVKELYRKGYGIEENATNEKYDTLVNRFLAEEVADKSGTS